MADLGICYVTDHDFLYPTLLSVMSLRRFVPAEAAPVFVVVFGVEALVLDGVGNLARDLGVSFIDAGDRTLPGSSAFDWSETHVAPAAVGRFLLSELLPPDVRRILYVDGDTMVVGSLAPLLAYQVPEGALAAADDASTLYRTDRSANGRETRAYLDRIGVPEGRSYFNSGVFMVRRDTWAGMAAKALRYLLAHPGRCRYHDQSALNATVGAARIHLSPVWNFQTRYRSWGVPDILRPRILHFTGASKPWLGPLAPWQDAARALAADAAALGALSLPVGKMSQREVEGHNAQFTGFKQGLRGLIDLRRRARARAVVGLHRRAAI